VQVHARRGAEYVCGQTPLLGQVCVGKRRRRVEYTTVWGWVSVLLLLLMGVRVWVLLRVLCVVRVCVRMHLRLRGWGDMRQALCLDGSSAVDEFWHAERAMSHVRVLPACERRGLGDRECSRVLATHHAHHGQGRLRLRVRAARTALGSAATASASATTAG